MKNPFKDILKGMELSKEMMIKEGLWNDEITLEKWSDYASSHVLITQDERIKD